MDVNYIPPGISTDGKLPPTSSLVPRPSSLLPPPSSLLPGQWLPPWWPGLPSSSPPSQQPTSSAPLASPPPWCSYSLLTEHLTHANSLQILDLQQKGYPSWFRGIRLLLSLVFLLTHGFNVFSIMVLKKYSSIFMVTSSMPLHSSYHPTCFHICVIIQCAFTT